MKRRVFTFKISKEPLSSSEHAYSNSKSKRGSCRSKTPYLEQLIFPKLPKVLNWSSKLISTEMQSSTVAKLPFINLLLKGPRVSMEPLLNFLTSRTWS
jgi:hypothetical protein